jgi:hypothetical protein
MFIGTVALEALAGEDRFAELSDPIKKRRIAAQVEIPRK